MTGRLFGLARQARLPLTLTVAATAGGALASIAQMIIAGQLIVSALDRAPGTGAQLRLLLAVVFARAIFVAAAELSAQRLATRVKSHVRLELLHDLVSLGPCRASNAHTGELATTVVEGVEKLDPYFRRFVPQAIATAVVPLLVLSAVAWFDPLSALILALTAPLIPLFMWLLGAMAQRKARAQWRALSALGGRFLDTLQGLATLKTFGRERDAAAAVSAASEELRTRTMGVLRVAFLSGFVLELAASLSTAIVAVGIGVRLLEGAMPFGAGLTVLLLTPEFYLPFRQLGQRHHAGMEGVAAAEQIFAILDTPAPPVERSRRRAAPMAAVTLEHVTCRYPGAETPTLSDVSFTLVPRTMTAVVGPSGAGKTTLLRALLRFIEPVGGAIRVNGYRITDFDDAEWRRQVAYVPQRPHFIRGTVLDNLRVANPDASVGEVITAARGAEAHAFIDALPRGYLTPIDEAASSLSGGERQRLALARALLKPAPILLLDEPTASVDEISEALIARALARVCRERTVLMVAHRANSIKHADTVIVLKDGRVAETGTHADLYAAGKV